MGLPGRNAHSSLFNEIHEVHYTLHLIWRLTKIRGGKPSYTHTWMQILNPSTSAKPFMTKLQNWFAMLVNMISFRWHYNLIYLLLTNKCNFCCNIVNTFLCMQTCRMLAYVCSVCAIWITIRTFLKHSVNLNLYTAKLPTTDIKY